MEARIRSRLLAFRVVAVLGPRQAGKTTLARAVGVGSAGSARTYVSLDDTRTLESARRDPAAFVRALALPATIDEVQRAPDLLLAIKRLVDEDPSPGAFLLTGSADPWAVQHVHESLAGRLATVVLRPFTWGERTGRFEWNPLAGLLSAGSTREAASLFGTTAPAALDLGREILLGGFPVPSLALADDDREAWNEEYLRAYLDRDTPLLVRAEDVDLFLRFVRLVAASTGTLLNLSRISRDAGVSVDTIRRWFHVLKATFLAESLPPFFRNLRKRLVRTPKVHFSDTGLAAGLLGVRSWDQAERLNLAGPLAESWIHHHLRVFAELLPGPPALSYFRSAAGEECDFVVESPRRILPFEVKATESPTPRAAAGLRTLLAALGKEAPFGIVLHGGSDLFPLADRVLAVPVAAFLLGPEDRASRAGEGMVREAGPIPMAKSGSATRPRRRRTRVRRRA